MTLAVERERVFTLKSFAKQREAAIEYQKAHPVVVYQPNLRKQEVDETISYDSETESVTPDVSKANQTASAFAPSMISSRPASA